VQFGTKTEHVSIDICYARRIVFNNIDDKNVEIISYIIDVQKVVVLLLLLLLLVVVVVVVVIVAVLVRPKEVNQHLARDV
jgi:hypothetical protein